MSSQLGPRKTSYRLVKTAIGTLALVWTEAGLRSLTFPVATAEEAERETLRRHPEAVRPRSCPSWVEKLAKGLQALLAGEKIDLSEVDLDLEGVPQFHARIYREARKIKRGQTLTYGELARLAGSPLAARAVGQAMAKNPLPLVVPCHRVLAAGGRIGGFTAPGGLDSKGRLLLIEGATQLS